MDATILLLVSNAGIRGVLQSALESQGYVVLAVAELGAAVTRLEECPADLLIVRHYIESMPGHDAALYLRRKCPGIQVLIVGGLPEDLWLESREAAQGFDVFPKPFQVGELLEKVRDMLARHRNAPRP